MMSSIDIQAGWSNGGGGGVKETCVCVCVCVYVCDKRVVGKCV